MNGKAGFRYPLIVRKDIDGFFGLMIDNLVNLIVASTVCTYLLHMPKWLVFGRMLPGAGLSILVGNLYYSWQAKKLAEKEGRTDVTALPYGINTPSLFAFLFLIMLPVYTMTGDPLVAWKVGVAACFVNGIIEVLGSFIGEKIRTVTPRAALLSTLAGIAIAFISMIPTLEIFALPVVGFLPFAIIMLQYFSRIRFPGGLPAGLVAVVTGTVIAWLAGEMSGSEVREAAGSVGFYPPRVTIGEFIAGLPVVIPYISIVLPMAVANFLGTMQNVESAEAAGDRYRTFPTMFVNGIGTLTGAFLGSCYPTTVYIGHPGWKAIGARRGYSLLNGIFITLVCITGAMGLVMTVVPVEAGASILLWIGLIIGAQAFHAVPKRYYPAVVLGFIPHIASWGLLQVQNALKAAGTSPASLGLAVLEGAGIDYEGLVVLGSGALLSAMMLTAILVFLIDRRFLTAALWTLATAVLSYIGLIHSEALDPGGAAGPALGYVLMAILFFIIYVYRAARGESAAGDEAPDGHSGLSE
jgi:AGZA family xanthine/uracil permease-like MFS transporter